MVLFFFPYLSVHTFYIFQTPDNSFELELAHRCGYAIKNRSLWFINPHYRQKFTSSKMLIES